MRQHQTLDRLQEHVIQRWTSIFIVPRPARLRGVEHRTYQTVGMVPPSMTNSAPWIAAARSEANVGTTPDYPNLNNIMLNKT